MIGLCNPHVVSAEIVVARPAVQRLRYEAACTSARCGYLAGTGGGRACTRTDCGLSDRFNHSQDDAA